MKPYYQDDYATLYCADCREILPTFTEKQFDLCLTDFPYANGTEYGAYEDTLENLLVLIRDVVPEMRRVSKRVLIATGTRFMHKYPEPEWTLCVTSHGGGIGVCQWGFTEWQPILAYGKDPYYENSMGSRSDTIRENHISITNGHPCPKPLNIWQRVLVRGSISGDILDPFAGSGTTLVAAKQLGRKSIGIELEEKYCEIAAKRLSQDILPFAEPPKEQSLQLTIGDRMLKGLDI